MTDLKNQNYYEILQCKFGATHEELKRNYQTLAKQMHPDKKSSDSDTKADESHTFILIDKAWKVLRDEELRKQYDIALLQKEVDDQQFIYDVVNLEELQFNEEGFADYHCRCGSTYNIDRSDFNCTNEECNDVLVECEECSNCIKVVNKS